jgi:hypothetical protein
MGPGSPSSDLKKYIIQYSDDVNFVTGLTRNGEQVIMGIPDLCVAAAFFDAQGKHLRHETRRLTNALPPSSLNPHNALRDLIPQLWALVDAWKLEVGFMPSAISVFKFSLPDLELGIDDLPKYLQDIVDDPSSELDEQHRQECLSEIEEWRRLGKFAVCWGNEYWMSSTGAVTDT